jgi:formiminotetrahydrofolate cyclodeaminase
MGAALVCMAARLTGRKSADPSMKENLDLIVERTERLWRQLLELSQNDIEAYRAVLAARRASQAVPLEDAYRRAAEVPLEVARLAASALQLEAELRPIAWKMIESDLHTGAGLLRAGLNGALENVAINLPELSGSARQSIEAAYEDLRRAYR